MRRIKNRRHADEREAFSRFMAVAGVIFLLLALLGFFLEWKRTTGGDVTIEAARYTDSAVWGEDELVYHKKKNDRMEIALTFDDGPHPYYTPIILDILDDYGISATFFTVGENIEYYPKTAERLLESGHEVENHTFSHARIGNMCYGDIISEIERCEDAVASVSERKTKFLRPPQGQMSETVKEVIKELDYRVVLWDVDTRDWAHTSPENIKDNVLSVVTAGDIILMHDFIGHDSPTPAALRLLIPELIERGYKFVTVSELIDGNP
ncbi:MAG: chitooligosaccharide deacetylase [Ruminococcaceae bacterium]|nr:chitooligosaccharide deacetylase [Oscillospiraceae bacterium]